MLRKQEDLEQTIRRLRSQLNYSNKVSLSVHKQDSNDVDGNKSINDSLSQS